MNTNNQRTRVVITGLGAVSPLGSTTESLWTGCLNGQSGIRRITQFDASDYPCQIAGEIPDFDVENYIERKEARRLPRSAQIAFAAATQAVIDAHLPDNMPDPERAAVVFGTAMGGVERIDEGITTLRSLGVDRVNPFIIPSAIPNLSSFLTPILPQMAVPQPPPARHSSLATQLAMQPNHCARLSPARLLKSTTNPRRTSALSKVWPR